MLYHTIAKTDLSCSKAENYATTTRAGNISPDRWLSFSNTVNN